MSFRFRKRVRVAPGVRLNFSKRGISTSVGRQGASLTLGKRGLYGNTGIPGSGLSYRTKLNKKTSGRSTTGRQAERPQTASSDSAHVEAVWDPQIMDVRFERSDGAPLTADDEKKVRRAYKSDITAIYNEKAAEINHQTERLIDLHHNLFQPLPSLETAAVSALNLTLKVPDYNNIEKEEFIREKNSLSFIKKLMLILPSRKKELNRKVAELADKRFNDETSRYKDESAALEEEKNTRIELAHEVLKGNTDATETWIGLFLDELDFPLETDVDYHISSPERVYVDMDLPNLEDVPFKKAKVLPSGKFKLEDKTQRDHREHYALMAGGSAFYLASFFFAYLPELKEVVLSAYNQVVSPSTGHERDQYIFSLRIDRASLYSMNMERVHPVKAFEQFEPVINVTKTFIFKEIEPYKPPELN